MKRRDRKPLKPLVPKTRGPSPSKIDPTGTTSIRRAMMSLIKGKFARLKGKIVTLIGRDDALGLITPSDVSISPAHITNTPYDRYSPEDELSESRVSNSFCSTGEGGGVDPSCSPDKSNTSDGGGDKDSSGSKSPGTTLLHNALEGWLKDSNLSPQQASSYRDAFHTVIGGMPEASRIIFHSNLDKVIFHSSTQEVTNAFRRTGGYPRGKVGGFWDFDPGSDTGKQGKGTLHVNGGSDTGEDYTGPIHLISHIYSHESGHVLDRGHLLSNSKEWREAYNSEIKTPGDSLSKAATKSPAEGFAEYARLLFLHPDKAKDKQFSKCYSAWKKHGLLDSDTQVGNTFCPTGKGGGIDSSCSPGKSARAVKLRESWSKILSEKASHLEPSMQQQYKIGFDRVLEKMSEEGLSRLTANCKKVTLYADRHSMTAAMAKNHPEQFAPILAKNMTAGGGFEKGNGKLHMDGPYWVDTGDTGGEGKWVHPAHGFAHEMTHAIDGPTHEISNGEEWQKAFKAEISGGQLTRYGATKPSEGFAEFGRLVLIGATKRKDIESKYPLCSAVWAKYKLWKE